MEDPPGVFAGVYHALLQAGLKQEERVSDESYHPLGQRRQVLQHAANNCGSAVNLRKLCDSHPLLVIPRPRRMQRCAIYTISPGLSLDITPPTEHRTGWYFPKRPEIRHNRVCVISCITYGSSSLLDGTKGYTYSSRLFHDTFPLIGQRSEAP